MGNNEKKNNFARDYRILSSYLNRWATVIVFSAIIALTVGALYIRSDDLAHMPVVIGVSALDSSRAAPTLELFADFCRGKGCGDIRWRFLPPEGPLTHCDFYLTTSLKLSAALSRESLGCALIAAEREAHRYSRSVVIVRPGVTSLPPGGRVIFASTLSAAGFLSPYRALVRAGFELSGASIDFTGPFPQEERVVLGVLYGAYDAGGISLERLEALERAGAVRRGELDVLCEGEALPEIVLAYDPASYSDERESFAKRLMDIFDGSPRALRQELAALGIAGFYAPRASDIELMKRLQTMIPQDYAPDPPGDAGARR